MEQLERGHSIRSLLTTAGIYTCMAVLVLSLSSVSTASEDSREIYRPGISAGAGWT